jgi:hypothetical protein
MVACILLLPVSTVTAEQLYVQSKQAKLMAEPRADATVVITLERGTALQVLDSNASWRHVRSAGSEGWVFRYFLTPHPPLAPQAITLTDDVNREHTRRRASAVVTAGATRGLTPQERERAHQQGLADYGALSRLEQMVIDTAQVEDFIRAGIPQ